MLQRHLPDNRFLVSDAPEAIAADVLAVNQIESFPTLLEVLCETTGMRFAVISRVTETTWTACVVQDDLGLGITPGGQLDVEATLCIEAKRTSAAIVIEHASADPRYRHHPVRERFGIESVASFPIVLASGRYFGNLLAMDPAPVAVAEPKVRGMFDKFAALIALQIDNEFTQAGTRSELRESNANSDLREQFIAILGHDLRNPLHAIYATAEMLERKLLDTTLRGMALRIRTNAKRMSALIDDILDFARGSMGGGIGVHMAPIASIEEGLQSVIKEFQDGQPQRQLIAEVTVGRTVYCDMGRVQQLASNLIGNALTHGSPACPVKVTARTEDEHLVLAVWNMGEPIPSHSIGKIFEPFWRRYTAADREGLGLGLHICSQIVRAHGGTLAVTSTRDGTTFTARLPLQP